MKRRSFVGLLIGLVVGSGIVRKSYMQVQREEKNQVRVLSIIDLPKSADEIRNRVQQALQQAEQRLADFVTASPSFSLHQALTSYDRIVHELSQQVWLLGFLEQVSPHEALRTAAQHELEKLNAFIIEHIGQNKTVYEVFKRYVQDEKKESAVDRYVLSELLDEFKRNGLELSDKERAHVGELNKKIASLCLKFGSNIARGGRTVEVLEADLQGLDAEFIQRLERTKEGLCVLGTDAPTYTNVMELCSVESTRKKMYYAYVSRAYPENESVLYDLIAHRGRLARALGYQSYAHFDCANQMVASYDAAQKFVTDLVARVQEKAKKEVELLKVSLPVGVTLTAEGTFKPWDVMYVRSLFKKKFCNVDEHEVAKYFPAERTLQQLMHIFEQFFGLKIVAYPVQNMWHESVSCVSVHDAKAGKFYGYILLDLYPRKDKYNHAAMFSLVKGVKGSDQPAIAAVVANFPPATTSKPALLKHQDVLTLFHEFGHAFHELLGATEYAMFSGTQCKIDFVELPSQMLEEWMWDESLLARVSSHYQTGKPLPSDLLRRMVALKNVEIGAHVLRQMFYASLSLECYGPGEKKNIPHVVEQLSKRLLPFVAHDPANYLYASFGHLTEYGAKYYGYMWSKVFALDLFSEIKKTGLLSDEVGGRYKDAILSKGGSVAPKTMLEQFLGRAPSMNAFIVDLDL